jgi:hypothetical protein
MSFSSYRPLTRIAELWADELGKPHRAGQLYREMIEAVCDGDFFDDGLAIRSHALLLAIDTDRASYDPGSLGAEVGLGGSIQTKRNERLSEHERVRSRMELHEYIAPSLTGHVPEAVWLDPAVFFDWVKHTGSNSTNEAVDRLFKHVSIGKWAFRNWVFKRQPSTPKFVDDWPDDLPHDPNHRGLGTLPMRELISLCEVVTWLTTGKARQAAVLSRLMRRHTGGRWPPGLWRQLQEDAEKLIAGLRRGEFPAYGQLDSGPHEAIPNDYFSSDVFAEFAKDLIAPDPLAFERDSYPEGLPTYQNVRFHRSDVFEHLAGKVRADSGSGPGLLATIAGQTRCYRWLVELMERGPQETSKSEYGAYARAEFGIGQRQFLRAWDNAIAQVQNPDWGKSGRRQKR